jgi:hypothetical protein
MRQNLVIPSLYLRIFPKLLRVYHRCLRSQSLMASCILKTGAVAPRHLCWITFELFRRHLVLHVRFSTGASILWRRKPKAQLSSLVMDIGLHLNMSPSALLCRLIEAGSCCNDRQLSFHCSPSLHSRTYRHLQAC